MILKAIFSVVQQFCSFDTMSFTVNLLIKNGFHCYCVPCMFEYVRYEPFYFKKRRFVYDAKEETFGYLPKQQFSKENG